MYINWALHWFPKFFGAIAFIVNPIFVYLIFSGRFVKFGNYRFLLLYFATFNVIYSITDILVPIGIHNYRYCFSIFIINGYFMSPSTLNLNLLIVRCSLISCSYAIHTSHFLYRYLVVQGSQFVEHYFISFMSTSFTLCMLYFLLWFKVCQRIGFMNQEKLDYLKEDYFKFYNVTDPSDLNILAGLFNEGSAPTVNSSWVGIVALTVLSVVSVIIYVVLGYLIMKKLNIIGVKLSSRTRKLQRDLLKALIVQTVIPILVSFVPCMLSWYAPAFNIELGSEINNANAIALSAFPWFDPVAIVMCLPVLRQRVICWKASRERSQMEIHNVPVVLSSTAKLY